MYMYMYYVNMYVYIYIYHVHLHRFVQNMPWPPVALLAPLPAPAPLRRCSTAPDPRAPRGPRGPALQQQDLQPHLLTVDLNQKTLETSSLLLLAFLDATTIKQKKNKKTKKMTVSRIVKIFQKPTFTISCSLIFCHHSCTHLAAWQGLLLPRSPRPALGASKVQGWRRQQPLGGGEPMIFTPQETGDFFWVEIQEHLRSSYGSSSKII